METDNIKVLCESGDIYAAAGDYKKTHYSWLLAANDDNAHERKYKIGIAISKE